MLENFEALKSTSDYSGPYQAEVDPYPMRRNRNVDQALCSTLQRTAPFNSSRSSLGEHVVVQSIIPQHESESYPPILL